MANALYDKGRQAFLEGGINWTSDTIKLVLIDVADYTVSTTTHDNLDDIPSAARVAVSGAFTGKTAIDGVADADDVVLPTVIGDPCEALVIFKDSGTESTSKLIAYFDTATGLPVTPNAGNITIQWDGGANKIFKL